MRRLLIVLVAAASAVLALALARVGGSRRSRAACPRRSPRGSTSRTARSRSGASASRARASSSRRAARSSRRRRARPAPRPSTGTCTCGSASVRLPSLPTPRSWRSGPTRSSTTQSRCSGCQQPLIALNELWGSSLPTPLTPTAERYRENVLRFVRRLSERGARPALLVSSEPFTGGGAAAWWKSIGAGLGHRAREVREREPHLARRCRRRLAAAPRELPPSRRRSCSRSASRRRASGS